jgi:hypothetical protein
MAGMAAAMAECRRMFADSCAAPAETTEPPADRPAGPDESEESER